MRALGAVIGSGGTTEEMIANMGRHGQGQGRLGNGWGWVVAPVSVICTNLCSICGRYSSR
jgi:hypothetical protein